MKLTTEDKQHLIEWGYSERDLPQIEEAMRRDKTAYKIGSCSISREDAIVALGRLEYLSGIARSAFHFSAARTASDGRVVIFDSSRLFRKGGKA